MLAPSPSAAAGGAAAAVRSLLHPSLLPPEPGSPAPPPLPVCAAVASGYFTYASVAALLSIYASYVVVVAVADFSHRMGVEWADVAKRVSRRWSSRRVPLGLVWGLGHWAPHCASCLPQPSAAPRLTLWGPLERTCRGTGADGACVHPLLQVPC